MFGPLPLKTTSALLACLVGSVWSAGSAIPPSAKLPRIAILDLKSTHPQVSAADLSTLSARLETEFQKTHSFLILERRNMDAILREQGFQHSGACTSDDCQVQVGQLLGVERILVGEVGRMNDYMTFDLKMIDVGSGQNLSSHALDVKGGMDVLLRGGTWEMAQLFSGKRKPTGERSVLTADKPRIWPWIAGGTIAVAGAAVAIVYLLRDPPESTPKKTVESTPL